MTRLLSFARPSTPSSKPLASVAHRKRNQWVGLAGGGPVGEFIFGVGPADSENPESSPGGTTDLTSGGEGSSAFVTTRYAPDKDVTVTGLRYYLESAPTQETQVRAAIIDANRTEYLETGPWVDMPLESGWSPVIPLPEYEVQEGQLLRYGIELLDDEIYVRWQRRGGFNHGSITTPYSNVKGTVKAESDTLAAIVRADVPRLVGKTNWANNTSVPAQVYGV